MKPIIEDQVAKPFPYENFPDEYPGDLNKKPKKKESFKLLCKTKKQWAKEILKAKDQALKEVLELDRLKEMPIYIGHIFDGEQLENKRYIGRKAEEKFKAELRASIKELMEVK